MYVLSTICIEYYNTTIIYTAIILWVGNMRRGSALGTCIRLPTPPDYSCKFNYINNLK